MEWMQEIKAELGWEDDERVYAATRAVLHAVRDRLPPEEAARFSDQLPLIMKVMFFEQYDPTDKPLKLRTREEFLDYVQRGFPGGNIDAERTVRGVMGAVGRRVDRDTLEKVSMSMPEAIGDLIVGMRIRQ